MVQRDWSVKSYLQPQRSGASSSPSEQGCCLSQEGWRPRPPMSSFLLRNLPHPWLHSVETQTLCSSPCKILHLCGSSGLFSIQMLTNVFLDPRSTLSKSRVMLQMLEMRCYNVIDKMMNATSRNYSGGIIRLLLKLLKVDGSLKALHVSCQIVTGKIRAPV